MGWRHRARAGRRCWMGLGMAGRKADRTRSSGGWTRQAPGRAAPRTPAAARGRIVSIEYSRLFCDRLGDCERPIGQRLQNVLVDYTLSAIRRAEMGSNGGMLSGSSSRESGGGISYRPALKTRGCNRRGAGRRRRRAFLLLFLLLLLLLLKALATREERERAGACRGVQDATPHSDRWRAPFLTAAASIGGAPDSHFQRLFVTLST